MFPSSSSSEEKGSDEQIVISLFFEHIRTFNYDKAKDLVDKSRETVKSASSSTSEVWSRILSALGLLAQAEKSYSSFYYLSPKWFRRQDTKGFYKEVSLECKKIEESPIRDEKLAALAHICGQLRPYVDLKCEMIEFFSLLHEMTGVKFCDRSDLLIKIKNVLRGSTNKFFHPQLEPLKTAFMSECEVIEQLLEADIAMSCWKFVDALLHLQEAHSRITNLLSHSAFYTAKEPWKLSFLGIKASAVPVLYTWLRQYKDAIYSKFTLYFYDVLSKQAPQGDMKPYLSRCSVDYYSRLAVFQKKTDASLISLVLNAEGLEVKGPGYSQNTYEFTGKQAYISIFCYPPECKESGPESTFSYLPDQHQTSMIMIMSSKDRQLNQSEKPFDFYDDVIKSTYFISRVDPTVSLVVIYRDRKSDREKRGVVAFLQEISALLRYTRLFQDLKPG